MAIQHTGLPGGAFSQQKPNLHLGLNWSGQHLPPQTPIWYSININEVSSLKSSNVCCFLINMMWGINLGTVLETQEKWMRLKRFSTFLIFQHYVPFSSVQSLSCVRLFATPWIAARQASLSITISWSSLKLTSIELVMPSSHLILCRPLFLLPPIPPSIKMAVWEGITNSCEKKRGEKQRRKGKI